MFPREENTTTHEYKDTYGDPYTFNNDVVGQGINYGCYIKMCEEASRLPDDRFGSFVRRRVEAQDDAYFLDINTWDDLAEMWEEH
jgi:hypothetical protein